MAGFHRKKEFRPGESLTEAVTADWLSSVEERLNRLEKMSVTAPLIKDETSLGTILSILSVSSSIDFVRLTEDLEPYTIANADALTLAAFLDASSSSENDIPLATDSTKQFNVLEINGTTSLEGTNGLALKFKRSVEGVYVFIPWPIGQGDHLPDYDLTKEQAITHSANGYLRWLDIGECSSSGL